VEVKLVLAITNTTGVQNALTSSLEALLDASSLITYDTGVVSGGMLTVTFQISADPTTGQSGEDKAEQLRTLVSSNSSLSSLVYPIVSVQIVGVDSSPIMVGQSVSSSSSPPSQSASGVIAGAVISFVALAAILVYLQYLRRSSNHDNTASKLNKFSSAPSSSSSNIGGQHTNMAPSSAAPSIVTTNGATPQSAETAAPPGWSRHLNDDGIPYYYNESTGESQWTRP